MDDMVFATGIYEVFSWDDILELGNEELIQFQVLKSKINDIRRKNGTIGDVYAVKKVSEEEFDKLLKKKDK